MTVNVLAKLKAIFPLKVTGTVRVHRKCARFTVSCLGLIYICSKDTGHLFSILACMIYCNSSRRLDLRLVFMNSRKRSYSSHSSQILRRRSPNRARASSALKLKSVFTRKINVKTKTRRIFLLFFHLFT